MEFEGLSVLFCKVRKHIMEENVFFLCSPIRGGDVLIFKLSFRVRRVQANVSA